VLFQIDSAKLDGELKDGTFGVYLLDTRVVDKDGATKPAGVKDGKLSLVNGYGLTTKATQVGKATAGGAFSSGSVSVSFSV
jgi:hypothetical protein